MVEGAEMAGTASRRMCSTLLQTAMRTNNLSGTILIRCDGACNAKYRVSACVSVGPSFRPSVRPSVGRSVGLSVSLSVCLCICISVYLLISLPMRCLYVDYIQIIYIHIHTYSKLYACRNRYIDIDKYVYIYREISICGFVDE